MRAVFLDRDGVLNQPIIRDGKPHPPAGVADVRLVPAVADSGVADPSADTKYYIERLRFREV